MNLSNLFHKLEIAFWSTLIPLMGNSNHGQAYQPTADLTHRDSRMGLFLTQALLLAVTGCVIGLFLGYVAEMF